MNLRSKFVVIGLLFFGVIYANYPNFLEFIPGLKKEDNSFYYLQKIEVFQRSLQALQSLDLFLVDEEKKEISVIGTDTSSIKELQKIEFFSDLFSEVEIIQKEDNYFLTSNNKNLSNIAENFNNLVLNTKKIEKIEFHEENLEILFFAKEDKTLFKGLEPIRSFIGDDLDFFYNPNTKAYSSKKKDAELLISLGLDLKGGIYLDLGIELNKIFENLAINLREELRNYFLEEGVFFSELVLSNEKNSLDISLVGNQEINWDKEKLQALLGYFEIRKNQLGGYEAFLPVSQKSTIEAAAIDQVINILNNRVNLLGVKEPSIQKKGIDSIIVQLPGQADPARARSIIQQSAKLDFRLIIQNADPDTPGENLVLTYEQKDTITGEITSVEELVVADRVIMSGEMVKDAKVIYSQTTGQPYVAVDFNNTGASVFAKITKENVGGNLAIILDNKIQSYPRINEPIYGGSAQISGNFTSQEASDLALVLRSGSLPTSLIINEERTVGASLGEDSIRASMIALLLGFVIVILLLLIYYQLSGLFCIFALIFNILIIFACLSYFRATLTLPGMAGIILTVGMAVDANILIFERIKEEMATNNNLHKSIGQGYRRSLWTILDANITTLLAAAILFQFGTGPIKGFALTLSIGIIASLFTSLFVSRFLFELFYRKTSKEKKISI